MSLAYRERTNPVELLACLMDKEAPIVVHRRKYQHAANHEKYELNQINTSVKIMRKQKQRTKQQEEKTEATTSNESEF